MPSRAISISVTAGERQFGVDFADAQPTLLANKWQTPRENVHEIRKPVWVRCTVELPDVHDIIFVLEDCSLVVIHVEIVWCGENRHDRREACCSCLLVHSIPGILSLVCSDYRKKVVSFEELACGGVGEEVRAASHVIVDESFGVVLVTEVFKRISP